MIHQLRPAWDFTLASETRVPREFHFQRDKQMQTILVFEKMVEEFETGLKGIADSIENGILSEEIDVSKLQGRYITIYSLPQELQAGNSMSLGLSSRPNYEPD